MRWLLKCHLLCQFGSLRVSHFISKLKRLKSPLLQLILWGLALLLLQTSITAAPLVNSPPQTPITAAPLVNNPLAPPDTSSPQATLKSFMGNVNASHRILMEAYDQYLKEPGPLPSHLVREQANKAITLFKRAERCLDLSEIPPSLRPDVATEGTLMLKEILDRIALPPDTDIPDAKAVATDKELSRWTIPHTEIDIIKVEEGTKAGEFLFSPHTVAYLEKFYQDVKKLPYKLTATEGFYQFYISTPGRLFPLKWFQGLPSWLNIIYWDQTLWQWISLGISLSIAFLIPYQSFRWSYRKVSVLQPPQKIWIMLLSPIIAIISLATVSYLIDWWINITGEMYLILLTILGIIFWAMVTLTIFLLSNVLAETIISSPRINPQGLDASLIRTVFRLLGLMIGITILILGMARVGISLVPVLASLGIGGLALALAARPTLENIIAGLILFIDRSVCVGDFCRFGDEAGIVEEIGLRSTRIRGLDRTITSVPNADFSQRELVNYSRRDRIMLKTIIGLRYETSSEQLLFVLTKLREMLFAHPKLLKKTVEVRFVNYGDYSLDVEIVAYVDTSNWSDFLEIQENILLQIKNIVEVAGTDFAFPSQTTYISRDSGLNQERSLAAEAQVQAWRAEGKLPFSEFPAVQSD